MLQGGVNGRETAATDDNILTGRQSVLLMNIVHLDDLFVVDARDRRNQGLGASSHNDAICDDPIYPLVKITALYGLRRSEVLGLKWDSVDFAAGRLTIKHTVSKVTTAVCKDKTKNSSSRRSFPLSQEAREIFLSAKTEEQINRQLCGADYEENDYIFKWPNGKPFSPDYVSSHFAHLLRDKHMPHIRFHELRHSCASLLLNSGCTLKDVQEYMGHADIQMTANIYGHLDMQRKQLLTEKMTASLF